MSRCCDGSGRASRVVSEPHSEGRNGDRARLACSESARHVVCDAEQNVCGDERCCGPCPGAPVRSALHIGRREGDAVWHQRSDRRIPPRETVVKRSFMNSFMNVSVTRTCAAGQHTDAGRHVRAKFASCAQTPSRSAGPARAGSERSGEPCTASSTAPPWRTCRRGQHRPGQTVAQILPVRRRRNLS